MNSPSLPSLLCALSLAGAVFAEEIPSSVNDPAATRFPGPIVINRFVPPVSPPPKEVPAMRIEASSVRQGREHRVTVLRGEASELPDIPDPAIQEPPSEEELARREAFLSRYRPPVPLNFGATIYDGRLSIVQWRHPDDVSIAYEAAVALDFGVFANAGRFFHQGREHHLFLLHHDIDTRRLSRFGGGWGRLPELPAVAEGSYVITQGDPHDAAGTYPLDALMELFANEKATLLEARRKRLEHERESRRWHELHPPAKKAEAATYWLRPHRGSRYLTGANGDAKKGGSAR